jgi:hypothetical protein
VSKKTTKKGRIDVGKLVRGIARERIGQPKSEQTVPDKRRKRLEEIEKREERNDQ